MAEHRAPGNRGRARWWAVGITALLFMVGPVRAGSPTESAAAAGASERPRLTVPRLTGRPVLDGRPDESFWSQACRVQGFLRFPVNELASSQPAAWVAWSEEGLWLAVQVPLPLGSLPRAVLVEHDSPVYSEDAVELFLQPPGAPPTDYCQFMVSAIGTRYDARIAGGATDVGGYNPEWRAAASTAAGSWSVEILLPFAAWGGAGPAADGTVWRGNLCVDSASGFSNALTWAPMAASFSEPDHFGELALSPGDRTVRLEELVGFATGQPRMSCALVGDFQPIVTLSADLTDSSGTNLLHYLLPLRDTRSALVELPTLTTGLYRLAVRAADEQGETLLSQGFRFRTAKAFDLAIRTFPRAGHALLAADARGLRGLVAAVDCQVTGPDGARTAQTRIEIGSDGTGQSSLGLEGLVPGSYTVQATVRAPDGAVLDSTSRDLQVYPKPVWWGNDLGLDHSVPPPWGPVQPTADGLSVWGREYIFGGTVFPRQMTSQGVELLAAPPSLRLTAGNDTVDLATLPESGRISFPDAVTVTATRATAGLRLEARTTLEFDGFLRCDLTLTPAADPVTVDELALVLPVRRAVGQFLLTSNGGSASIQPLTQAAASGFLPYVWLGNDEMGLAWAADSDRHWSPQPRRAIVASVSPEVTELRVNLVATRTLVAAPVAFSFALMPSPVRPIPTNDPFAYPSYSASGEVTFSESLTYPIPAGLATGAGTLECWVRRTPEHPWAATGLFRVGGTRQAVIASLATPDRPRELMLTDLETGTELLRAEVPLETDRFVHLALVWESDTVACYADCRRVGQAGAEAAKALRASLQESDARLRLGCGDEYSGYTGIVLDEVRLSSVVRYRGHAYEVPVKALIPDRQTLVLDPLDEDFRPDGQDARTTADGVPSIGSVWTEGRFGRGLCLQVAPPRPGLDLLQEMGVRVGTHWAWQDDMAGFYGQPVLFAEDKLVPGIRQSLGEWHRRGIPILPYLAFPAISSTSGLLERYGDEWATEPRSTLAWQFPGAPPGYHFLNCCQQARGYADYFAAGVVWAMDDLGFDGFYSDGLTSISACSNEGHGCGYRDADGNLHPTYPFFATRETLKRMYRLVKARGSGALVANHCSFNLMLPLLSFSDIVYTGEHEDYENPLTARLRFSGRPWGLYITLLGSSEHVYSPLHAMAPLLSGSSVWGSGLIGRNDFGRKDAAIRAVYHQFDTASAVWVPWWEAGACCADDPSVRVSFYCHPGQSALLVVGNFGSTDLSPALTLDLDRYGLSRKSLRAWNALTGVAVPITGPGRLAPLVRAKSFALLRLE